jgi:general secretion pathway protein J
MNLPFKSHQKEQQGFTLIEVLIVIGIFSVISSICYISISQYIKINDQLEIKIKTLNRFERLFLLLDRDLRYAVPRSARNDLGEIEDAVVIDNPSGLPGERIRTTTAYPGYNETGVEVLFRIAWQFDGGNIYRYVWNTLDTSEPLFEGEMLILEGVTDFSIEIYYWTDEYGLQSTTDLDTTELLPAGIKITVLMDDGSEYYRSIDMAGDV